MKITCHTIAEFLQNVEGFDLVDNQIFISRHEIVIAGGPDRRRATSVEVYMQASAILASDTHDYHLQAAELCGIDRFTSDGTTEGTDRYLELLSAATRWAAEYSIRILPGVLET